jgi:hypothetical protein
MLRVFGLLFVALLIVAGMGFGYWIHQDRQARGFVTASVPAIYKDWRAEAVSQRMPHMLQTPAFEGEVRDMFRKVAPHLGPLVSAGAPEGTFGYDRADNRLPKALYGRYVCHAKFRDGEADLRFLVVKEEGLWRIVQFALESPQLTAALQKQQATQGARPNYVRGPPDEESAVLAAADEILRIIDSEDPGSAWNRGSIPFQQAKTKRRFVADMRRLHDKSGHPQGRKLQGVGFAFDRANADPPGDYAIVDYLSTYSRMKLHERLGFYRREGSWKFSGHDWSRVDESRE